MRKALTAITSLFGVLVTLSLVVGPIWEQLERQRAIRDFPAPGHVIDIGRTHIQIECRGVGIPTVAFESGLGPFGSLSWAKVQDEVAKFTRACAYSRAGIIWSDDKDGPHEGRPATGFHAALAAAGESGPFVMTSHSIGGPYITIYTKLYGDEVSGLVYVDASHPDQFERFEAALGKPLEAPMLAKVAKIRGCRGRVSCALARLFLVAMRPTRPAKHWRFRTPLRPNRSAQLRANTWHLLRAAPSPVSRTRGQRPDSAFVSKGQFWGSRL